MKSVIVIPARAGSKGIPGKNLQPIEGESLVARAARKAKASRFDAVYVYSDSEEIRRAGEAAGAIPAERPAEVSGDDATSEATIARFLKDLDPKKEIEVLGLVQCTTPFLRTAHVDEALARLRRERLDSVVTVCAVNRFLAYRGGYPHKEFVPVFPYRAMRQHFAGKIFMENGGLYLAKRAIWESGKRFGGAVGALFMGWWESIEIDEPLDLAVARAIAPLMDRGGANAPA